MFDPAGQRKLGFTKTNNEMELLPGKYVVSLNRVKREIEIEPGKPTVVEAGTLAVSGEAKGLYYVYYQTGENRLDFRGTNRDIELFPGKYVVTLEGKKFPVEIRAKERTGIKP